MQGALERLSPILRLTRVTAAFAVVADAWFVVLWTRAHPQEWAHDSLHEDPAWLVLGSAAAHALGLFGFGMCLNDILDQRRDRALRPDRPLASGAARVETAVALTASSLIVAVLGSTVFGTRAVLLTIVLAAAILAFNGAARFVPAFGLVSYGLIYAGAMFVPNSRLNFVVPVWVVLTQVTFMAALGHVLGRRIPPISARAWWLVVGQWAAWSGALAWIGWWRNRATGGVWPSWVNPAAAGWVAGVVVVLALVCWRKARVAGRGTRLADKFARYGTLALSAYTVAWMFGVGLNREGVVLLVLGVAGFLGMTVLRELYALAEHPLGYRR